MKQTGAITWQLRDGTTRVTAGYSALNLLAHAEIHELQLPQACGGQAECGTCRVRVLSGSVKEPFGDERDLMERHRKAFEADERLACRARPLSDLVICLRPPPADLRTS